MGRARHRGAGLAAAEHRSKERILTQADPAKIRKSTSAVVLKHGSLFLLTDEGGDVPSPLPHGYGLFLDDCRFLDAFELTLDGRAATTLAGTGMRGFETRHRLTQRDGRHERAEEHHRRRTPAIHPRRVKTRLPGSPRPVPPIFQPEVAAEAVLWAADHDRPEMYVGAPTVVAVLGNKLAPRLADRYLAHTGYTSQQTDDPVDVNRQHNLWAPVPGDHGAHGRFGERAHSFSVQLWVTMRRRALVVGAALIAGAGPWRCGTPVREHHVAARPGARARAPPRAP
jgi:hypothetical protein